MSNTYYTVLKEMRKIMCLACGKYLSGLNVSTIKRHYKLVHKREIRECVDEKSRKKRKRDKFENKSSFLRSCVALVAAKNLPFSIFDDKIYFKALLRPHEKLFKTNLNSRYMMMLIESANLQLRERIQKRVAHKVVSLKIDIASIRSDRSILGVQIQYIQDFKMHIDTLGIIQLQKQQHNNGSYLKDAIVKCLMMYQIDPGQIYSSTTDDGSNVLKDSKFLLNEYDDDELLEFAAVEECNNDEQLHIALASALSTVRCVAHTIQLVADDVLKLLQTEIKACRNIVKHARHTLINAGENKLQIPTLDHPTRWRSTLGMLKTLLKLKDHIDKIYNDAVRNTNWKFVESCVAAFQPLVKLAKQLNGDNRWSIVGDFYRDWLLCEMELEELFGKTQPYARLLYEAMQMRKNMLLDDEAFLAALYLDPRFNFENTVMLNDEQKNKAVIHLVKTFHMINVADENPLHSEIQIKSEPPSSPTNSTLNADCGEMSSSTTKNRYSKLEHRITMLMTTPTTATDAQRTFKQKIILLSNGKKLPLDTDVLSYWKTLITDYDIQKIVEVVLAYPATQTSIERTYSALTVILTKLKSKLNQTTIDDLLMTKLNFHDIDDNIIFK